MSHRPCCPPTFCIRRRWLIRPRRDGDNWILDASLFFCKSPTFKIRVTIMNSLDCHGCNFVGTFRRLFASMTGSSKFSLIFHTLEMKMAKSSDCHWSKAFNQKFPNSISANVCMLVEIIGAAELWILMGKSTKMLQHRRHSISQITQ